MPFSIATAISTILEHRLLSLIVLVLFVLSADFLFRFCLPALYLNRALQRILRALSSRKLRIAQQAGFDLQAMIGEAAAYPVFVRPWREFVKTLHPKKNLDTTGEVDTTTWRATCLAEVFFTEKVLVDTPLRTQYYAHLPGILTGVGIIGTFRGLIEGLRNFLPSMNPGAMQDALASLIGTVANAFLTSAAAIVLAILFTLIEKILLNACYRKVEGLQQLVDRMFYLGAGEEYLELLASASARSASHATELKEEFVAQLGKLLHELTLSQVEAITRSGKENSNRVAEVITQRLGGPIDNIAEAVKYVGASQREAIHAMLGEVLAHLMGGIDKAFGSKMDGIAVLLTQMTKKLEQTASRLDTLAASAVSTARDSAGSMAAQLKDVLEAMAATHQATALETQSFLGRIEEIITRLQAETAEKQLQLLASLRDQIAAVMAQLHEQSARLLEQQRRESARSIENAVDVVRLLSREVEKLVDKADEVARVTQDSLSSFSSTVHGEMDRVAAGAELIYASSSELAKAGATASTSVSGLSGAIEHFQAANLSLGSSVTGLAQIAADHEKGRKAFAETLSSLSGIAENTRREASATAEMVATIQGAAAQLASAGKQAEHYLGKVNEVLAKAHQSFAENIDKTLNHGNARFHVELARAVDLLASGIRELEDAISVIPARSQ